MPMTYQRKVFIDKLKEWEGCKIGDERHHHIVETYNTIRPLPVGYKLTYYDAWCAATQSACAWEVGYGDIFPFECSCTRMIENAKRMGIWQERDDYVPSPADLLIYDWEDDGVGDCVGQPNHVGCVIEVDNDKKTMTILEGNMGNQSVCGRRILPFNSRYIRGFVCPKYDCYEYVPDVTYTVKESDHKYITNVVHKYNKEHGTNYLWANVARLNGIGLLLKAGQTIILEKGKMT